MGRPPCCDKSNVKKGIWTAEEDAKILAYVSSHGIGNWTLVPKKAGLNRCGKSCRLRWTNYLRPDLKHEGFTLQEEELIINLHQAIGSRWSLIAKQLPGRTDNDVKNYWNTKLRKKLLKMGIDPITHKPVSQVLSEFGNVSGLPNSANRIRSLNNNSNAISTEPAENPNIAIYPAIQQVNNPSGDFMPQFQDIMQPLFFSEVTSSCSSSSSSPLVNRSSSPPRLYSCQPPHQAQVTPTPDPFSWSEFLLCDPFLSMDFQQQKEQELQGVPSAANNSSALAQNNALQCMFSIGNDHNLNRAGHGGSVIYHCGETGANQATKNGGDASCSSASSFVDAILVRDSEIGSQFPDLSDGCFDY